MGLFEWRIVEVREEMWGMREGMFVSHHVSFANQRLVNLLLQVETQFPLHTARLRAYQIRREIIINYSIKCLFLIHR